MRKESGFQFAGIIPARYASSRFPGKPLVIIGNKTMVQRVYEQALKSAILVYVATDDERIFEAVKKFGASPIHRKTFLRKLLAEEENLGTKELRH